jgi:ribosomal protein L7Ae-like RNA K-turn-binding protein
VFGLIAKLKKLYYNRKVNPQKKGKQITRLQTLKKRYILGMKEVLKHLLAENVKLVILATNLERVEGDKGIDEIVHEIL